MNKTTIEYIDYTWNPLSMRCTPVSEGCENCWHIKTADRLGANPKILHDVRLSYHGNAPPMIVASRLDEPLKLKKPSVIGVQFMGDLFHKDVKIELQDSVMSRISQRPEHIFLFLTKRPDKMAYFMNECGIFNYGILPNLWLGVTAENQQRADERIPILLQIPATKRFVSIEPMLGPVDLTSIGPHHSNGIHRTNALRETIAMFVQAQWTTEKIDWVIVGGESGPGARPMHPDWVRSVRDQCQKAGVPFFFKQWGEWIMFRESDLIKYPPTCKTIEVEQYSDPMQCKRITLCRVGKQAAGRLLDDREYNERPIR